MHENTRITPENWQAVAHLLPQTALELAAVIGIEAACILIDRYGGQKIPAAKGITGQGCKTIAAYAELIGGKAAERLQNGIFLHLDDSGYHVPKCDGARRHLRDTAIREDFDRMTATMTARAAMMELARGSGLTSRRVAKARVRIDARKWKAARLAPKKYGEKSELDMKSSDGSMTPKAGQVQMSKEDFQGALSEALKEITR